MVSLFWVDADLLALGKAIFGSGVGNRVSDMIEVDSKEFAQQLPVLEQQYKGQTLTF